MVKAARKYNRIVQVGTQNRSALTTSPPENISRMANWARSTCAACSTRKVWPQLPQCSRTPSRPKGFDWDMWNGPAPEHDYNPTLRLNWHHWWRYSSGDIANDGAHQFDLARWIWALDCPRRCIASGGRFNTNGAAETPDTQIATFTYEN